MVCEKIKLNSFLAHKEACDDPPNRGRDELDKVPPDLRCYVLWPEELLQDKRDPENYIQKQEISD